MTNNRQKLTDLEQTKVKKITSLEPISFKQLDQISAGVSGVFSSSSSNSSGQASASG